MKFRTFFKPLLWLLVVQMAWLVNAAESLALINGESGQSFTLTAGQDFLSTGDGNQLVFWGLSSDGGTPQYPSPTLIVSAGSTISITLNNTLAVNTSLVFPGQAVTATGGTPGLLAREAPPGGSVSYQVTPPGPGTYIYYSGTDPDLQIEMGILGAIVVRPAGFDPANPTAYGDSRSAYDHEYLFLHSEMDNEIHALMRSGRIDEIDTTTWFPVYWFLNGRTAPDTLAPPNANWLPTQPYDALARMHPGERVLMRVVGGGQDLHPFHAHGNNFTVIAENGRQLATAGDVTTNAFPDLSWSDFTLTVAPGQTYDAIFEWTGYGMGWDIYGHAAGSDETYLDMVGGDVARAAALGWPTGTVDPTDFVCAPANQDAGGYDIYTSEYCPDHDAPFPVVLPDQLDLTFGQFYSGSPFLGAMGALPPGEGGFNAFGGFFYMWHSHNEKELTNNDIFPGGLMTMMVVEHPSVDIPTAPVQ